MKIRDETLARDIQKAMANIYIKITQFEQTSCDQCCVKFYTMPNIIHILKVVVSVLEDNIKIRFSNLL